jgi:hypothetical protein
VGYESSEVIQDLAYVAGRSLAIFDPVYSDGRTVVNMVQGACATGSWLAFKNISTMSEKALKELAHHIELVKFALQRK